MKTKSTIQMLTRLTTLGFTTEEALQLRKISMTLHRWHELECGTGNAFATWHVERNEETNKPLMVRYDARSGLATASPIADRERGAINRLKALMSKHPSLVPYVQGDPRGCALYILKKSDVEGQDINSIYYRGVAVHE